MTRRSAPNIAVLFAALIGATACQVSTEQLKTVSAGHTGCTPEQLTISNYRSSSGGFLWNASCKGKTYLCSEVTSGKSSDETSCAPVMQ